MAYPVNTQHKALSYDADLGVSQYASTREIKAAWFKLAKRYHSGKKAPGKQIDAKEFRKVGPNIAPWSRGTQLTRPDSRGIRSA
jgi:hypothetical protein